MRALAFIFEEFAMATKAILYNVIPQKCIRCIYNKNTEKISTRIVTHNLYHQIKLLIWNCSHFFSFLFILAPNNSLYKIYSILYKTFIMGTNQYEKKRRDIPSPCPKFQPASLSMCMWKMFEKLVTLILSCM